MAVPVLWHIEISHYNEKARWALDYKGIPHRRRAPMPGVLHPVVAMAKTRKPLFPILDLDGESIGDSTTIIETLERRYPEPPLYPADPAGLTRALELEEYFDVEVAPHMRRLMFWEMSRDPERAAEGMKVLGMPSLPGRLAGGATQLVSRRYGGNEERLERDRQHAMAGFERILSEVGPSGYMVGDSFSVADLTAASILYHLAEPPEFQYEIPVMPDYVYTWRDTLPQDSLDWIRGMWSRHRPPSASIDG
jgi:glutathione S-transferase